MPKGPKGEKRPADPIANAVRVARIATGEEPEELTDDGKDAAAVSLGRRGGKARAGSMMELGSVGVFGLLAAVNAFAKVSAAKPSRWAKL